MKMFHLSDEVVAVPRTLSESACARSKSVSSGNSKRLVAATCVVESSMMTLPLKAQMLLCEATQDAGRHALGFAKVVNALESPRKV